MVIRPDVREPKTARSNPPPHPPRAGHQRRLAGRLPRLRPIRRSPPATDPAKPARGPWRKLRLHLADHRDAEGLTAHALARDRTDDRVGDRALREDRGRGRLA